MTTLISGGREAISPVTTTHPPAMAAAQRLDPLSDRLNVEGLGQPFWRMARQIKNALTAAHRLHLMLEASDPVRLDDAVDSHFCCIEETIGLIGRLSIDETVVVCEI